MSYKGIPKIFRSFWLGLFLRMPCQINAIFSTPILAPSLQLTLKLILALIRKELIEIFHLITHVTISMLKYVVVYVGVQSSSLVIKYCVI